MNNKTYKIIHNSLLRIMFEKEEPTILDLKEKLRTQYGIDTKFEILYGSKVLPDSEKLDSKKIYTVSEKNTGQG